MIINLQAEDEILYGKGGTFIDSSAFSNSVCNQRTGLGLQYITFFNKASDFYNFTTVP